MDTNLFPLWFNHQRGRQHPGRYLLCSWHERTQPRTDHNHKDPSASSRKIFNFPCRAAAERGAGRSHACGPSPRPTAGRTYLPARPRHRADLRSACVFGGTCGCPACRAMPNQPCATYYRKSATLRARRGGQRRDGVAVLRLPALPAGTCQSRSQKTEMNRTIVRMVMSHDHGSHFIVQLDSLIF